MPTFHSHVKTIRRSRGSSAVQAAAYRSGTRMHDERTGITHDYSSRKDVLDRTILAPRGVPSWVEDRATLWNRVEAREPRYNSQVARELQITLADELSFEENRMTLHTYVRSEFVARGMIADVAIHGPREHGDQRNIHAHIMLTMRGIEEDDFGLKERSWNDRGLAVAWRASWEQHLNTALERADIAERVDHRSFADRGIDREPEPRLDYASYRLERKGQRTVAGDERRAVRERNRERDLIRSELRGVQQELEKLSLPSSHVVHYDGSTKDKPVEAIPCIMAGDSSEAEFSKDRVQSQSYERELRDSWFARAWRFERQTKGLHITTDSMDLHDHGEKLIGQDGSDELVAAMLDLATWKGWKSIQIRGEDDFKQKMMNAAIDAGLSMVIPDHDIDLLGEVEWERDREQREFDMSELGLSR